VPGDDGDALTLGEAVDDVVREEGEDDATESHEASSHGQCRASDAVRLFEVPSTERPPNQDARRLADGDARQERGAYGREGDLVRGDLLLTHRPEQDGQCRKGQHLASELDAGRDADLGHLGQGAPQREGGPRRDLRRLPRVAGEEGQHGNELEPLGRGRAEATSAHAKGREPEVPVDEPVRQPGIDQVAQDTHHHGRARVADRLAVLDERRQHAGRGGSVADGGEEPRSRGDERGIDLQRQKHRGDVAGEAPHEGPEDGPHEEPCLGKDQPLLGLTAPDRVCGGDLHGAHQPKDDGVPQEHERSADSHAAQRRWTQTADQLGVDQAEEGFAEHGPGDGPREIEELAQE